MRSGLPSSCSRDPDKLSLASTAFPPQHQQRNRNEAQRTQSARRQGHRGEARPNHGDRQDRHRRWKFDHGSDHARRRRRPSAQVRRPGDRDHQGDRDHRRQVIGVRSRRAFLAGTAALALAPSFVRGQATRTVTDDTGRRAEVPLKVERVYAAGPPASILVFAVAPEKLLGWTTPFRPEERPFVPAKYADLPTLGRLTGRGNTANVEVVLAAKPDLIVDYGSVGPTYTSLADRVQTQTGIPYLLLDGAFNRMPQSRRRLGEILGEPARGRGCRSAS